MGTFGVILDLFASYIRLGLAPGASSEYEPEQRTVEEDEFPHQKYLNPIFIYTHLETIDQTIEVLFCKDDGY